MLLELCSIIFSYLVCPACLASGLYILPLLFLFFLTVPLESNYLTMYRTELHQLFRVGRHILVQMNDLTFYPVVQGT